MNKKKIIVIITILTLMILAIVFVINNSQIENNKKNSGLSEEEKQNIINEIKTELENTTEKPILSVNEEKITERELAFANYQLNNTAVNKTGENKDPVHEITKKYVVYQNAQELNISLSNEEIKEIKNQVKYDENIKELSKELDMSYDDFCEMYVKTTERAKVEMKWIAYIGDKIANGEINIDNELFNNKYKEYSESEDIPQKAKLLLEMLDIYKEYLVDQANIEIIN